MKKFVMYGAGNIGRGFIGKIMSEAGYKVGFVDINPAVIGELNTKRRYPVNIVTSEENKEVWVENVYGIDGKNEEEVSEEIASCDAMASAVGVNVLKFIAKNVALGIQKRMERGAKPLNIIICENLIGADAFLKELVRGYLPEEYKVRLDKELGFVEASIGRMVPAITEDKKQGENLRVYVEPYNILPVDKDAFRGEMPECKNLYPFAPFNLFIQRKLFMHNMSHATTSYLGALYGDEYVYQSIARFDVKYVAYRALSESANALAKENQVDILPLFDHADNLLYRFTNTALGDTVARVGKDTIRKLGENDRLVGALKLCKKHGIEHSYICIGIAAALLFAPEGDESSKEVKAYTEENGVKAACAKYMNMAEDFAEEVSLIAEIYAKFKNGESVPSVISFVEKYNNKSMKV